jgi:O-antigen biosynthesis protein WbqV
MAISPIMNIPFTRRLDVRMVVNIGVDGVLAALAVWAGFWLTDPARPWPVPGLMPLAGALVVWLIGVPFGLSRLHWRFVSFRDLGMIGAAALVTAIMLVLLMVGAGLAMPSAAFPVALALALMVLLTAPRLLYRLLRSRRTERDAAQTAILVGTGETAELFLAAHARAQAGYRIVGLMALSEKHVGRRVHGLDIFGAVDAADAAFGRLADKPDLLIITAPELGGETLGVLLGAAERHGIRVLRAPSLTRLAPADQALELQPIAIEDLLNRRQVRLDRAGMARMIAGKRVLVTGAGGSIGSELARQVAGFAPAELMLLDHGEFALWQIDLEIAELRPALARRTVIADVRDRGRMAAVCEDFRPELVFHAAALKHVPIVEANPLEGLRTNALGTRAVADAAAASGAALMVLISTDKAVNPSSIMGASKRLAEMYCQSLDVAARQRAGSARQGVESARQGPGSARQGAESARQGAAMRCVTVRFGNVLGSTGSVVPLFRRQLAQGGPLTVTHPEMQRYFMTVREAVGLVLQASVVGGADKIIEVGGADRRIGAGGADKRIGAGGADKRNETGAADKIPDGGIFVLDMGEPVKIVDLARQMIRLAGLRPDTDIAIRFTGLRPGEKLFEELFHGSERPAPTGHEGLLMATPRVTDARLIIAALRDIEAAAMAGDAAAAIAILSRLVPEFVSPEALAISGAAG